MSMLLFPRRRRASIRPVPSWVINEKACSKGKFIRGEEMGCPIPACAKCTDKDPSPVVTSFFKVMIGDKFSEIMFLPPKFAPTVSDLIDQKTQLEDASGQKWMVTLSKYDGSLAFQQGWPAFSLEHGLEVGDFVLFHYIAPSRFVVQIFGKSGCEKLKFSKENSNQKKRTRANRDSTAKDEQWHTIDSVSINSMNKQGSNTSAASGSEIKTNQRQHTAIYETSNVDNVNERLQHVPKTKYIEEPFYMIDRDYEDRQEYHRSSLYDLANFEMQRTSGVDGTNKVLPEDVRPPGHVNTMPQSQAEAEIVDKLPVTEEVGSWPTLSDVPNLSILEKNKDIQMTDNLSKQDSGNGNTFGRDRRSKTHYSNDQGLISQKNNTLLMGSNQSAQQKFAGMSKFCGVPVPFQTQNCQSGERTKVVKNEQVEMREVCGPGKMIHGKYPELKECGQSPSPAIKDNDHVYKVVKTEPVDAIKLSSTVSVKIPSLAVSGEQSFLELPSCLPSISFKGRSLMERKVFVRLRDPVARLWPVLYHDKHGMTVLASGWEAFGKYNGIQPGDECVFEVENESESIYRVGIVRKY